MAEKKTFGTIVKKDTGFFLKIEGKREMVPLDHLASSDYIRKGEGTRVEVIYSAPQRSIAGLVASAAGNAGKTWQVLCYAPAALQNIVVNVEKKEADRVLRDMVRQGHLTKSKAAEIGKFKGRTGVNTFK